MKKGLLFILTLTILFFVPATTQAGFLVKKKVVAVEYQAHALQQTMMSQYSAEDQAAITQAVATIRESASPSRTFVRMLYRGQVSTLALVMGILGVFIPMFSVAAIVFGYIGFSTQRARNRGLGIAAFILGLATIAVLAFSGNAPLPIF